MALRSSLSYSWCIRCLQLNGCSEPILYCCNLSRYRIPKNNLNRRYQIKPFHPTIRHYPTYIKHFSLKGRLSYLPIHRTFATAQKYRPTIKKEEKDDLQVETNSNNTVKSIDSNLGQIESIKCRSTSINNPSTDQNIPSDENTIDISKCNNSNTNGKNKLESFNESNVSTDLSKNISLPKLSPSTKSTTTKCETKESDDKKGMETKPSSELIESKLKSEELPSGLQRYFFLRYFTYLNKFQQSLENEMPDTFQMFRIFSTGIKQFIIDIKDYIGILLVLSLPGERLVTLSMRELELYYYMPRDMIRVFPVLSVSSIPLGQNIAFPIAYWFPQTLLCRHFWRQDQKFEFATNNLRKRLYNARLVFRSLQVYLDDIIDEELQNKCQNVFFKLGSGIHPDLDEVLELMPLFRNGPYQLVDIRAGHLNALLCLHGRSALPFRKSRLRDHAQFLLLFDNAIRREGVNNLSIEKLTECLFIRGVNPLNLDREEMLEILKDWLYISEKIDCNTYSLLLHLPIFMAYNHPTNLSLVS